MVELNKTLYYIAAPFWHEDENVRNFRRRKAIEYSESLFHKGVLFYSPLLFSERFKEKKAKENFWLTHGQKMVKACDAMRVLCLDGYKESSGVEKEIECAQKIGLPVEYIKKFTSVSFHGSRSLTFQQCKPVILDAFEKLQIETVVTHGEPEGACQWSRQLAKENGLSLTCHHLQHWRMQGQFHWRSVAVLEGSERAVFMHDGKSNGTAGEMALAKKMGIPYDYYILENGKLVLKTQEKEDVKDYTLDLIDDAFETKLPQSIRKSPEYQRFRKAVLDRDGHKCVFCNATEDLCVHHIIPYTKNNSLSLDISNGQTLCDTCHRSVHGKPPRN